MKIVIFNIPTSGHVDPSLPLTAELVSRGHEVIYYLTEAYRKRVEATGAEYRETPGVSADMFDEVTARFNPMKLATILLEKALDLTVPMTAVLRDAQPDFVIHDSMCPWGWLAAGQAGMTAVSSMSLISPEMSTIMKGGQAGQVLRLLPRMLKAGGGFRRASRQVEDRFGVKLPPMDQIINKPGKLTVCYTTAEIHPLSGKLGESYLFIGPDTSTGQAEVEFPFEQLDDRPLIYVSLGTVFNKNPGFFKGCLAAFRGTDYQVVMSLGRGMPVSALGAIPDNFIVRDYVPQFEILRRARLYITHGGVGSIHQALYSGVPLLIVPQQLEHAMTAVRMEELGAGRRLRQETAEAIRNGADRILEDDSYSHSAEQLGLGLRKAGGVKRAVDVLEKKL